MAGIGAAGEPGGITVVQDPSDAAFPEMPATALARVHTPITSWASWACRRCSKNWFGSPWVSGALAGTFEYEVDIARGGRGSMSEMDRIGRRSVLACPDCHGVMWEIGSALRALDERVALARKLENEAHSSGRTKIAESWADKARVFEEEAKVIRDSIRRTDEIVVRSAGRTPGMACQIGCMQKLRALLIGMVVNGRKSR